MSVDLDELLAGLEARPDDRVLRSLIADALLADDEPQGRVLAHHLRGLPCPEEEHALEALIAQVLRVKHDALSLTWRDGFVDELVFWDSSSIEEIARWWAELMQRLTQPRALVAATPRADVTTHQQLQAVRALQLVRSVAVGPWAMRCNYDELWRLFSQTLLPPTVRQFRADGINHPLRDEHQLTWITLGALDLAGRAFEQLEHLRLRGSYAVLGELSLPALRTFELTTSSLTPGNLAELRAARWPRLTHLSLGFGDDRYNPAPCTLDHVRALLRELPASVTHLGLRSVPFASELLEAMVGMPVLRRLTSLDLSGGLLFEGHSTLRSEAPAFAHLQTLDVTATGLPDAEALREDVPGLCWQGSPHKRHRYVSLGE
jgi:hypothetical protein